MPSLVTRSRRDFYHDNYDPLWGIVLELCTSKFLQSICRLNTFFRGPPFIPKQSFLSDLGAQSGSWIAIPAINSRYASHPRRACPSDGVPSHRSF